MTTAEAIEGITDAGMFEILATGVLRITDDDCRLLEHMGVNAAGKTVANPIDSFCRVPGTNPPRFVMAAFTTDKVESLERKWLFDHSAVPSAKEVSASDDGDLIKASFRAQALRKDHPGSTVVVHLCTNKQPNDQLMAKVLKRGKDLGLDVRFLTRSRLRDTLDVYPDGQWLRKEHLGIQAERLSFLLLCELSAKSLQQYAKEFPTTTPDVFIGTSTERRLATSLAPSRSIYVVTGASGIGKSVVCYQVLREHLAKGGVGLWIPGEVVGRATSLVEAIGLTLRSIHPTLEPTAGSIALGQKVSPKRLIVVVDDINRSLSPEESLRKVLAWGRPLGDEQTNNSAQCAILVPVWDIYWTALDKQVGQASWLARIPVNKMDITEALACLSSALGSRQQQLTQIERQQVLTALVHDPILIAMYAGSAPGHGELNPQALENEIIDRFVKTAEDETAIAGGHLQHEYDNALSRLATCMLNQKDLYPLWEDIKLWLSTSEVEAIRDLIRLGKVCRLNGRGDGVRFEFRHDRILEHFLVRALIPMFTSADSNREVLTDPFYALFVGRALAANQASEEILEWVQTHAPLALISSLRYLPALQSDTGERAATRAKAWLEAASNERITRPVLRWTAYRILEGTDNPHLLRVTQSLGRHPWITRARLANGDAYAGILEFSSKNWFAPAVNDADLDSVLNRGLSRFRQRLISDCSICLQKSDLTEAEMLGSLVLAGFIADEALATSVRIAWRLASVKTNLLLPALWAGIRCAGPAPEIVLDEMIAAWGAIPDDDGSARYSERESIAHELQFALPRGIEETVLGYLIAKARANDQLRGPISFILERVDHPLSVLFLIETASEIERRIKGKGGISPWLISLSTQWDPTNRNGGRRLTPKAVQAIRSCWESAEGDTQLRDTAFEFWVNAVDDIDALRSISTDHPQFRSVLRRRAILGDLSTVPLIKPLASADHHWFHFISRIWTEEFKDVLTEAIQSLSGRTSTDYSGGTTNEHYQIAELLRDIPGEVARDILPRHWGNLKFSRLFVQLALYIGSPECVALAAEAIGGYPADAEPFEHIDFFFGFHTSGLMDRLELRHLDVLLPYLKRLDDYTLDRLAEFCERRSFFDWGRSHLKPVIDWRRANSPKATKESAEHIERIGRSHFPSDIDLQEQLDSIEHLKGNHSGQIHIWLEGFELRHEEDERWRQILDRWLSRKPTIERFRVFADAFLERGRRSDIELLHKHSISGDPDEIELLRANAQFGIMRRVLR